MNIYSTGSKNPMQQRTSNESHEQGMTQVPPRTVTTTTKPTEARLEYYFGTVRQRTDDIELNNAA